MRLQTTATIHVGAGDKPGEPVWLKRGLLYVPLDGRPSAAIAGDPADIAAWASAVAAAALAMVEE